MNLINPAIFKVANGLVKPLGGLLGTTLAQQAALGAGPVALSECAQQAAQKQANEGIAGRVFQEGIPPHSVLWAVAQKFSDVTWGWMERAFPGSTASSQKAQNSLLKALRQISPESFFHSARVADMALRFARELDLDEQEQDLLERSSYLKESGMVALQLAAMEQSERSEMADVLREAGHLHDLGKLALPAEILEKPGPLSPEEYELVQLHPMIGEALLQPLDGYESVLPAVRYHHERWDGLGYPDRLAGTEIPKVARIISLVDSYDAMTGERCYRKNLSPEEAAREILAGAGTQFDPDLAVRFADMVLQGQI